MMGWTEPVNYKSGISVFFGGVENQDWGEEIFWYKPIEDDKKVVYLKADTLITMQHNERNMRQAPNSFVYEYDIGINGGGVIRYCVDRDLQIHYRWGGDNILYPAYNGPFSFSNLTYGTGYSDDDSMVPVVGSTGDNGAVLTDRAVYYHYGCMDEFGDEWHEITFADDDTELQQSLGDTYVENFASDGKKILFVVNPKTPLIRFTVLDNNAQFYTTPPKANYIPKVHRQTTYLTNNVFIDLYNIMDGNPVWYRLDGSEWIQYQSQLVSQDIFSQSDTEYNFEYVYQMQNPNDNLTGSIKLRVIHFDPSFPSAGENHGYLLWEDDAEFAVIKERCLNEELYSYRYNHTKDRVDFYAKFDERSGQGKRYRFETALSNAFIGLIEGIENDTGAANDGESCIKRAKRVLLDNATSLDDLWINQGSGSPNPSSEVRYRGYYTVNIYFSTVFAYDLLIKEFTSDKYQEGITPIEDYKIRDSLAKFALDALMVLGEYERYAAIRGKSGMWGTSRQIGALIIALAMPSYNTHYYGTSGFDGSSAVYKWTPYPDYPVSWKEVLYDETAVFHGFPNMAHRLGINEQLTTERTIRPYDGVELPIGSFMDRRGYYGYSLMGHTFHILSNVMKIKFNHTYDLFEKSYENANRGALYGYKINADSDIPPAQYPQILLVNKRFPNIAGEANAYLLRKENEGARAGSLSYELYRSGIYGLVWYDNSGDWPETGDSVIQNADTSMTNLQCYNNIINSNKDDKAVIWINLTEAAHMELVIYDSKGKEIKIVYKGHHNAGSDSFHWDGTDGSDKKVGSGVYLVHMKSGGYEETKKIVVVR